MIKLKVGNSWLYTTLAPMNLRFQLQELVFIEDGPNPARPPGGAIQQAWPAGLPSQPARGPDLAGPPWQGLAGWPARGADLVAWPNASG